MQKDTTTVYWAECHKCHTSSNKQYSVDDTTNELLHAGWTILRHKNWNTREIITTYTCDDCSRAIGLNEISSKIIDTKY